MRSVLRTAQASARARSLMIWLPGAYQAPEDFLHAGFDRQVARRGLSIDLQFVDLEMQNLVDRSGIAALWREVVEPALHTGTSVWLAGISLGGFAALDLAAAHPEGWHGLCLLAPYLGNRMLLREIAAAPGLAAWQPCELAQADEERRIWQFLRARRSDPRPLYLGYGRTDRFALGHSLLAASLPTGCVDHVPGGHDWPTWSTLWERFLDAGLA